MSEALKLAVIEHLGLVALAHGKMSLLEAFEKGWQAALSQPAPLGLAELMRRLQFEDQVLDNEHRMAFLSQLRDDARVAITALVQERDVLKADKAAPAPQGVAEVMQGIETVAWRDNGSYRCTAKQRPDWINPAQLVYRSDVEQAITALVQERDDASLAFYTVVNEIDVLKDRIAELEEDVTRIDWLELQINQNGAIHLHDGANPSAHGLGLRPGNMVRTLREAIDTAIAASKEAP